MSCTFTILKRKDKGKKFKDREILRYLADPTNDNTYNASDLKVIKQSDNTYIVECLLPETSKSFFGENITPEERKNIRSYLPKKWNYTRKGYSKRVIKNSSYLSIYE